MTWTDDRIEQLKKLWADGCSSGLIASVLEVTRNAVIGKVNRMGLPKKKDTTPKQVLPRQQKPGKFTMRLRPESFSPAVEAPTPIPEELEEIGRCSIMDLGPNSCRWIVGNPATPMEKIYCGDSAADFPIEPYCPRHRMRAASARSAA